MVTLSQKVVCCQHGSSFGHLMGSHMAFAAKQSSFYLARATSGVGETCGETWLVSTLPPIWFGHGVGIFSDHGCKMAILGP